MRTFHRTRGPRKIFVRSLVESLVHAGKIETTVPRAKEIRPIVEHLITIAKRQNLASRRLLLSRLTKGATEKLYHDLAPRYKERRGGYLRITKLSSVRKRDGAPLARIEFVE
jgi:large subunit ribosomal protein L17